MRVDDGPMFGNLPQRAVRLQERFDRLLERQDRVSPRACSPTCSAGTSGPRRSRAAGRRSCRSDPCPRWRAASTNIVSCERTDRRQPAAGGHGRGAARQLERSGSVHGAPPRRHGVHGRRARVPRRPRRHRPDRDGDETWCDGVAHAARQLPDLPPGRRGGLPRRRRARAVRGSRRAARARPRAATSFRSPARSDHERFKQDRTDGPRRQDDAACRHRTRTAAPRARHAGAVRALGDAADRHAAVRHALLHDARAAAPDAGARRYRDDAQHLDRRRPRDRAVAARRHRAAAADLEHDPRARAVSRRSTTRSTGHAAAASSAGSRCCSSRTACACCSRLATRSIPNPGNDEPLAETRFVFVDGRWRPERAR